MKIRSRYNPIGFLHRHTMAVKSAQVSTPALPMIILVTGLLLTITTFSFLNNFISRVIVEDYHRVLIETQDDIGGNLLELEHSISGVDTLVGLTPNISAALQAGMRDNLLPKLYNFDRVFLLRLNENSVWQSTDLQPIKNNTLLPGILAPGAEANLAAQLIARFNQSRSQTIVISDLPMLPTMKPMPVSLKSGFF